MANAVTPLSPDEMRRMACRLRDQAEDLDSPSKVKAYRRKAAWWEDQATLQELRERSERNYQEVMAKFYPKEGPDQAPPSPDAPR